METGKDGMLLLPMSPALLVAGTKKKRSTVKVKKKKFPTRANSFFFSVDLFSEGR